MAERHQQGKAIGFETIQLFKDQTLGIGSYGKVCKAKCDDLLCAAKLIHETLFDPTAQQLIAPQREHRLPMRRFEQECEFLSTIKHPNIVQYLGIYRDPDTSLPALLMELMDDSLTHFLESSPQPIPYHIQVNVCHDITLALSFLHSNGIVHRDLSSNNVLLIGNVRAKVTDFGMARLGDQNSRATQLTFTMCPGTDVYMPPEAIQDKPEYTDKIDCFSFGVITLQILTQEFPKPGDRRKQIEINHPGLPKCALIEARVSEVDRRQNHINKIDPNHTLLPISLDCLKDKDVERPSAQQLCERVMALKDSPQYRETQSVRVIEVRSIAEPDRNDERDRELRSLRQQHHQQVQRLQQIAESQNLMSRLDEKEQALREKDEIMAAEQQYSQQVQGLRQIIESQKSQLDEKEQALRRKDKAMAAEQQQLQQQHSQQVQGLQQIIQSQISRLHEKKQALKKSNETMAAEQQQLQWQLQQQVNENHQLTSRLHEKEHALKKSNETMAAEQQQLQWQLQQQVNENHQLTSQLHEKEQALKKSNETMAAEQQQLQWQLQQNHQLMREKNQVIEEKKRIERQLGSVNQQLEESKRVITRFQRQIAELEQLTPASNATPRSKEQSSSRASVKLMWREGKKAPCRMRYSHCSAVDSNMLYVKVGTELVHAFNISTSTWSQLPDCPFMYDCPLVIISNLLTLIGGDTSEELTINTSNKLFSLTGEGSASSRRWTEEFPCMPTKRCESTALCTGTALIVVGGKAKNGSLLKIVEVMNILTKQWSTAADIPQPVTFAPAAVRGDRVYILGSSSMYTCSVITLIQSCKSFLARLRKEDTGVWTKVAAPPISYTTCVSIHGRLLAIGGMNPDTQSTTAIHEYNPTIDSWEIISHMGTPRLDCIAAVLPNNQIMVVGGYTNEDIVYSTDSVEFASVE